MEEITLEEKIFGLSNFWQEAKYNFAYFENLNDLNWDQTYQEFLTKVLQSKSDFDYYRILEQFAALLKDGHTRIIAPEELVNLIGRPRLHVENINRRVFITNLDCKLAEDIELGSEIIKINNYPTRLFITKYILPYISSSTETMRWQLAICENLLIGKLVDNIAITIKSPNKKTTELTLTRSAFNEKIEWLIANNETPEIYFKWINQSIAYINISHFNHRNIVDTFISYHKDLLTSKAIIIDLRNNGGGNGLYALEIASYFSKHKIKEAQSYSRINNSAKRAHGVIVRDYKYLLIDDPSTAAEIKDALDHINGNAWQIINETHISDFNISEPITAPLILLTDIYTASAAEDFLLYLDSVKRGTRIGQTSSGSTGTPILLTLPADGIGLICSKKCTFPDGRSYAGIGIPPHIEIEKCLQSIITKADPSLNKAISILSENLLTDPV